MVLSSQIRFKFSYKFSIWNSNKETFIIRHIKGVKSSKLATKKNSMNFMHVQWNIVTLIYTVIYEFKSSLIIDDIIISARYSCMLAVADFVFSKIITVEIFETE